MRKQAKVTTAILSMVLTVSFALTVPAEATTTPSKVQNSQTKPTVTNTSKAIPSTTVSYVNGKDVTKQGEPAYRGGVLYLPIEVIANEMGDKFTYNNKPYTGVVTKKDGTKIHLSVTKSVAIVDGKSIPVSIKKLQNTNVPVQAKPIVVNDKMYVPSDFISDFLKYPFETSKNGSKESIFVGKKPSGTVVTPTPTPSQPNNGGAKLDLPYQPPAGWVPSQIKTVATEDAKKNWQILDAELGFTNGSLYNPYGKDAYEGVGAIIIGGSDLDKNILTRITFNYWKGGKAGDDANRVPYVSRELFKFYLGQEDGLKLFKIMDDGYNGKDISQYIGKVFTLGGRQIKIIDGDAVRVIISLKGRSLK
ncbi:stalk domain-containing protein [Brevibacillus borstelensis]